MSDTKALKNSLLLKISKDRKKQIRFLLFAFLSLAVMVIIFLFSNQPAIKSAVLSDTLANTIIPEEEDQRALKVLLFGNFVRKFAHFVLFAVLGFLLGAAATNIDGKNTLKKLSIVAVIGLFYGITDEFHQLFISGRSGEPLDVLIDFSGVVVGITGVWFIYKIYHRYKFKKKNM